jgi:HSP20 family protein
MANMIRWNPVRELAAMQNMMDRMFDESLRNMGMADELEGSALALDVHETDTNFEVAASLPGVSEDNIHINLHDDILTIQAEIPDQTSERQEGRTLIRERRYGKFSRRIRLPQPVNADAVEADFNNGVLTLTLPKAENALPRNIPVRRHNGGQSHQDNQN